MQTIDIIIAVLLIIGLISGLRDGVVKQVAGLAGLIGGLLLGCTFYHQVGEWLVGTFGMSAEAANIVAFILILVFVPLLFSIAGWFVSKLLSIICLGWVNRLLGGIVGILKLALFVGVLITGVEYFDKQNSFVSKEKKETSIFYYPIYEGTSLLLKGVSEQIQQADNL